MHDWWVYVHCPYALHRCLPLLCLLYTSNRIHGIANYTDTLSKIPYRDKCQQTDYCNLKDPFENACNDVTVRFERKLLLSELFSPVPSASIFFAFKIFSPQMSSFKKRPSLSFHKIPLYQKMCIRDSLGGAECKCMKYPEHMRTIWGQYEGINTLYTFPEYWFF